MPKPNSTAERNKRYGMLVRLTTLFFNRPRITALLWLALMVFGIFSYTTLLKREGFPDVQIPISVVTGVYPVNDPARVDAEAARHVVGAALAMDSVSAVQSSSSGNFFTVSIQFKGGTDAEAATSALEQEVRDQGLVPPNALMQYNVPYFGATGGDIEPIDIAVSLYREGQVETDITALTAKAEEAAEWLRSQNLSQVDQVFVKSPFEQTIGPDGQLAVIQRSFDRFGERENGRTAFHPSVIIGLSMKADADILKLDKEVEDALHVLAVQPQFEGYEAQISASFAPSIEENISELQRVLLEGLLAVLVVGSLVIAVRASIITVISMVTVLFISLAFLHVIGYTLNVITLFALILSLALIVDDTIIMVEAIDAARRRGTSRLAIVKDATSRISRAMVAATLTAALSFAPLLFVGGILGSFIRAIPITIIASLLISLLVALVFIPLFSRVILLRKLDVKRQSAGGMARLEDGLASFITWPMRKVRNAPRRLFAVWLVTAVIGVGFVLGGLAIGRNVIFNIFPPSKDTNGLVVRLNFPQGTDLQEAAAISEKADAIISAAVGENFSKASYYATGSAQSATVQIQLTPYTEREVTSPELVRQLQERFNADFPEARAAVGQLDVGPPTSDFTVLITADDREAAYRAANDIADFMRVTRLERLNGTAAQFVNVSVSSADEFLRVGNRPVVQVTGGFDGDDISTLVSLAETAVNERFDEATLGQYGLSADAVTFDIGQESENQESFNSLLLAFPAMLVVMYLLLAFQFRSLLQPLLIFLAIPFSLFGIMLGLDVTNNAISFFAMLGFFALVGLSIKNTILLTDYANQARHRGESAVDASVDALRERFRPLFATSLTAVVSLIPLAIASPFWEGLAVVLIFGLLSSTFLVVTVFPYYYLGAEYLRGRFGRLQTIVWLIVLVGGTVILGTTGNAEYIPVIILACLLVFPVHWTLRKIVAGIIS